MELRPDSVIAQRFRLERPLGQGGMGAVWVAHHLGLDVPCAIKFIEEAGADDPEMRMRFEREAKAAAQLRSPHVVQIFDHGVHEGVPYIAMELLEGEDLRHRLDREMRLAPAQVAALVAQVARALLRAHSAGITHRDLKPENIFLVRDDEAELVKVLDFGIAQQRAPGADPSNHTRTGRLMGSPSYMSPEQVQGQKTLDGRSDLWSLAVIVYECVTGRRPFESPALGELVLKICSEPLPVPSQAGFGDAAFDAWWARAASRDPALRFQTARELSDALSAALGVPPSGAGVSATVRLTAGFDRTARMSGAPQRGAVPEPRPAAPMPARTERISVSPGALEPQSSTSVWRWAALGTVVVGGLVGIAVSRTRAGTGSAAPLASTPASEASTTAASAASASDVPLPNERSSTGAVEPAPSAAPGPSASVASGDPLASVTAVDAGVIAAPPKPSVVSRTGVTAGAEGRGAGRLGAVGAGLGLGDASTVERRAGHRTDDQATVDAGSASPMGTRVGF